MLLTSHTLYMLLSLVLCSRQFFQVNKASLQRTSSTIIHLKFENVRVTTPHPPGSYYIHPKDI